MNCKQTANQYGNRHKIGCPQHQGRTQKRETKWKIARGIFDDADSSPWEETREPAPTLLEIPDARSTPILLCYLIKLLIPPNPPLPINTLPPPPQKNKKTNKHTHTHNNTTFHYHQFFMISSDVFYCLCGPLSMLSGKNGTLFAYLRLFTPFYLPKPFQSSQLVPDPSWTEFPLSPGS